MTMALDMAIPNQWDSFEKYWPGITAQWDIGCGDLEVVRLAACMFNDQQPTPVVLDSSGRFRRYDNSICAWLRSTWKAIGGPARISARAMTALRARRLIIPEADRDDFEIDDILIGGNSQFVAAGIAGIPAAQFTPTESPDLSLDPIAPGLDITITVRYVGNDPNGKQFRAAIMCRDRLSGTNQVLSLSSNAPIRKDVLVELYGGWGEADLEANVRRYSQALPYEIGSEPATPIAQFPTPT